MSHRLNEARTRRFLWHRKNASRFNGFTQRGEISSGTGWRLSLLLSEKSLWKHILSLSISFTNTHTHIYTLFLSLHTHAHTKIHRGCLKVSVLEYNVGNVWKVSPLPLNNIFLPPDCEDRENVCTRHTVTRCNAFKIEVIYSLVSYSALILNLSCGVNCIW